VRKIQISGKSAAPHEDPNPLARRVHGLRIKRHFLLANHREREEGGEWESWIT